MVIFRLKLVNALPVVRQQIIVFLIVVMAAVLINRKLLNALHVVIIPVMMNVALFVRNVIVKRIAMLLLHTTAYPALLSPLFFWQKSKLTLWLYLLNLKLSYLMSLLAMISLSLLLRMFTIALI
ncbi:TPA: hypothetical protein MH536_26535 [Klebsiella pneumoniae]|nr:hypothetical protein [Klebsiella pneumoniae]